MSSLNRRNEAIHLMSRSLMRVESVERKMILSALIEALMGFMMVESVLGEMFLLPTPALNLLTTRRLPLYSTRAVSIFIEAVSIESTLKRSFTKLLLVPNLNVVSRV